MKRIILGVFLFLLMPIMVFADSDYAKGVSIANEYVYTLPEYSRFINTSGTAPYGFSTYAVNDPHFKTGGFLTEREFVLSKNGDSSYLAPGIQFWLAGGKSLGLKADTVPNGSLSGVRVTEFVLRKTEVKGLGTITTPWEFVDGYYVKIGTTDKSLGVVTPEEGYLHIYPITGGTYTFTLKTTLPRAKLNLLECQNNKNGKFEISDDNKITVTKVVGDFNCNISFDNQCHAIAFDNNGGSNGMTGNIYYRYGRGWYGDSSCKTELPQLKVPTKAGYTFDGYKINGVTIIDANGSINPDVKNSNISAGTALAVFTACAPGTYLSGNKCIDCVAGTFSNESANTICKTCPAGSYSGNKAANCTICGTGKTSPAGSTSASACTGCTQTNVTEWNPTSWNSISGIITNHCSVAACETGYKIEDNKCKLNVFKFTLDRQGGTGGPSEIYEKYNSNWSSTPDGESVITSITKPTKTGFTFKGYFTEKNGSGTTIVNESASIVANTSYTEAKTVYANWIDSQAPTCSFTVTASNITLTTNDNVGVTSYGLTTSNSKNYNSQSTQALGAGTYYGWVKDAVGNEGSCRVTVAATVASKYTRKIQRCTETEGYTVTTSKCVSYNRYHVTGQECRFYHRGGKGNVYFWNTTQSWDADSCPSSGYCPPAGAWKILSCSRFTAYKFTTSTSSSTTCTTGTKPACSGASHVGNQYISKCTAANVYAFVDATPETNQDTCTVGSLTCNATNKNKTKVTKCTPTAWKCSDTSYTKVSNDYCYKIQ